MIQFKTTHLLLGTTVIALSTASIMWIAQPQPFDSENLFSFPYATGPPEPIFIVIIYFNFSVFPLVLTLALTGMSFLYWARHRPFLLTPIIFFSTAIAACCGAAGIFFPLCFSRSIIALLLATILITVEIAFRTPKSLSFLLPVLCFISGVSFYMEIWSMSYSLHLPD